MPKQRSLSFGIGYYIYFLLYFSLASCDDPLGTGKGSSQQRLSGLKLWLSQFSALIVKRFHYTKRRYIMLSIQNILPFLVLALSLLIAHNLQTVPDPPPLELSPDLFFVKSLENYMFVGGYEENDTTPIVETVFKPCGAGGHQLGLSTDPKSQCYYGNEPLTCPPILDQYICTCEENACQNDTVPFPFQSPAELPQCYMYNTTDTESRIQNLSSIFTNASDPEGTYELFTEYLLRSKNAFIENRYGGLTFGHVRTEVDPFVDEINIDPNGTLPFLATRAAAKVWYSFKSYHAMPTYINVMNNAILRANLDEDKDPAKYGKCVCVYVHMCATVCTFL